jgi:anti-sigma regulatory factor (Ser/Thr protein kinase)
MTATATASTSLIAFTLPGTPCSVRMARFYVRAALRYHDLSDLGEDCEAVASELVTNAVTHADSPSIGVELMRLEGSGRLAVGVAVTDSSPLPPVLREVRDDAEHGRGLHLVAALSAGWSWYPYGTGKAVYAILMRKAQPAEAISDHPVPGGISPGYPPSPRGGGQAVPRPGKGSPVA